MKRRAFVLGAGGLLAASHAPRLFGQTKESELDAMPQWADVANKLVEYEPVLMVIRKEDREIAKRILSSKIDIVEFPVNDGWSRD